MRYSRSCCLADFEFRCLRPDRRRHKITPREPGHARASDETRLQQLGRDSLAPTELQRVGHCVKDGESAVRQ